MRTRGQAREVSIRAVVHRADGTIEDRGVVSYWHRNPLRRLAYRLGVSLRRVLRGGTWRW